MSNHLREEGSQCAACSIQAAYIHRSFALSALGALWILLLSLHGSLAQAQSLAAQTQAPPLSAPSTADSLLAALPGVLIAGLALIFAIREHGRAKRLQLELEVENTQRLTAMNRETLHYLAAQYSAIGLWQVDGAGKTLYANPSMRELLGIDDIQALEGLEDKCFLKPVTAALAADRAGKPYGAILCNPLGNRDISVLVFEDKISHGLSNETITMRTVINLAALPPKLLDKRGDQFTIAA